MAENGEDFSTFLWQFVGGKPIVNQWQSHTQVPTETELSKRLSKALKNVDLSLLVPLLVMLLCKRQA